MLWLQTIDTGLFHFINRSLGNPVFDWLMPILSGHGVPWLIPLAVVAVLGALIFGGARARLCALMIALVVCLGDPLVIHTIKVGLGRPRPCIALPDVVHRLGCTDSGSMPSAHAANCFAVATVMFLFYRRSWCFMLPLVAGVGFSRIYCGVHYPSDVLVGAILGTGYALALAWSLEYLWQSAGRKWFPGWHTQMPSLINPPAKDDRLASNPNLTAAPADGAEWIRLGYILIIFLLVVRWLYLASGIIGLSEDEAYQWLWSKHLALSYYSKPLGIAFLQFAGTHLWGDTAFGVRFFSPLLASLTGVLLLRFMAREVGPQPAFWLLLIVTATPLLDVGAVLMTIDPPLVFFWTLAMVIGWRAVQPDGKTSHWLLAGLALGLSFLFKYTAMLQVVCWAVFFALAPATRKHLSKPGPWLALLVFLACTTPVLIWNSQHHWITVYHVAGDAGMHSEWKPTLHYLQDFTFSELFLLNPFFFVGALCACVVFWKWRRENPLLLYLFCMGAPVFFGHWLFSLHSRVLPNWIAASVLPMFCLMVACGTRYPRCARIFLTGGLGLGLIITVLMHDPDLIGKLNGPLPGEIDPSHRLRAGPETAAVVEAARENLVTNGEPAFIIADHYGITGLLSFYLPAARAAVNSEPLVYCIDADKPGNQFYFWPVYDYRAHRQGQNAIFVSLERNNPYAKGWFWHWLKREPIKWVPPKPEAVPARIANEFTSVTDLGVRDVWLKGRVFHRVHLWACYHLR
jgi:membrane-associated phospholipid phosphatase